MTCIASKMPAFLSKRPRRHAPRRPDISRLRFINAPGASPQAVFENMMPTSHVVCPPDASAGKIFRQGRRAPPSLSRPGARRVVSPARWICAGVLGSVLASSACAQEAWNPFSRAPRDPIEQGRIDSADDPAEAINREIFKANKFLDDVILKPVARAYVEDVSPELRRGIHNFTNNVGEPVVFANDVLQGNARRAWNTTQRFAVNTTIGVVGFLDVADSWGRPHHYADLGQTLGVWGIAPGPAVQIPILGPSNLRDAFGLATTSLAGTFALQGTIGNAISYTELGATGVDDIDYRSKLLPNTDALEKNSKDLYASIRLVKAQLRARFVEEGKAGGVSGDEGSSAEAEHH
jgi:phospholipid-binding lipoprotein MlaA